MKHESGFISTICVTQQWRRIPIQLSRIHLGITVVFSLFFQNLSDNQVLSFILPPSPQSVLLGYFKVLTDIWRGYCLNSDILAFDLESPTESIWMIKFRIHGRYILWEWLIQCLMLQWSNSHFSFKTCLEVNKL